VEEAVHGELRIPWRPRRVRQTDRVGGHEVPGAVLDRRQRVARRRGRRPAARNTIGQPFGGRPAGGAASFDELEEVVVVGGELDDRAVVVSERG
jgi:hypothetical protein